MYLQCSLIVDEEFFYVGYFLKYFLFKNLLK